jgi:hypothetical protein
MPLLAFVFAATWFVTGAMAAHLPHLLEIVGASATAAIAAAALVGPAQVGARLVEFGALRKVHPLVSARLAAILHPVGVVVLLATGPAAITAFSVFHGAGNGLLTIAKGTLPLAIFGPIGYGHRSGVIGAPARAAQAASPLIFGILIDHLGADVLWISACLNLSAAVALANGASRIVMVRTVEEALALREAGMGQICMGEVGGKPPVGFDFGNSPFEISNVDFRGQDNYPADQRRYAGHCCGQPGRTALRGLAGHGRGDRSCPSVRLTRSSLPRRYGRKWAGAN